MRIVIAQQLNLFWLALSFFSRLPTPANLNYTPEKMHSAGTYFSLVGWLLAIIMVISYQLLVPFIGIQPSVCIILVLNLLLTGAFHQDGLADMFDGFFGGYQREQKLTIMKDSRIGTYGSCALIMSLLLQFVLLSALAEQQQLLLALCISYPLSRAMALSHVQSAEYVAAGERDLSKSTSLVSAYSLPQLLMLFAIGSLGLWWLPLSQILLLVLGCFVLRALLQNRFQQHIGGITGDCLGAAQQFQEVLIYLLLLAMLSPVTSTAVVG
ncbi:adenosylcobinamide-GDP ribazoletransferase [Alteromonadaceae bacterium BrNp21-10]|nr:adenosylcobinamide-GDP ribazoletransferase [Alteromonadaceae bacterium BrNp21-10]